MDVCVVIKQHVKGDDDMRLEFEIHSVRSWKRPQHQYTEFNGEKKVWVFTPKELKEWEWMVIDSAFRNGLAKYPPIRNVDVKVEIHAYVQRVYFRDVDNIAKGVLDAIQPWLLADDKYVVELLSTKQTTRKSHEYLHVVINVDALDERDIVKKEVFLNGGGWDDSGWLDDLGLRAVYKFGKFVVGNEKGVKLATPAKLRKALVGKHYTFKWRR